MEPTISDVLNRAADILEEAGWVQGRAVDTSGGTMKFCAVGAICEAAHVLNTTNAWAATDLVREMLHLWHSLASWNDAPHRTKKEVIATLRQAANL